MCCLLVRTFFSVDLKSAAIFFFYSVKRIFLVFEYSNGDLTIRILFCMLCAHNEHTQNWTTA